jgi:predicted component of type VI protein secretion system
MAFLQKFQMRKPDFDIALEIVNNLRNILNTKKGYGSFLENFGIGDYNLYRAREIIIQNIIKEIKENITLYEPRVKVVEIQEVASDLAFRIRFELKCIIEKTSNPIYIIFHSALNDVAVEM